MKTSGRCEPGTLLDSALCISSLGRFLSVSSPCNKPKLWVGPFSVSSASTSSRLPDLRVFGGHSLNLQLVSEWGRAFGLLLPTLQGGEMLYTHLEINLHVGTRHWLDNTEGSLSLNSMGRQEIWAKTIWAGFYYPGPLPDTITQGPAV